MGIEARDLVPLAHFCCCASQTLPHVHAPADLQPNPVDNNGLSIDAITFPQDLTLTVSESVMDTTPSASSAPADQDPLKRLLPNDPNRSSFPRLATELSWDAALSSSDCPYQRDSTFLSGQTPNVRIMDDCDGRDSFGVKCQETPPKGSKVWAAGTHALGGSPVLHCAGHCCSRAWGRAPF